MDNRYGVGMRFAAGFILAPLVVLLSAQTVTQVAYPTQVKQGPIMSDASTSPMSTLASNCSAAVTAHVSLSITKQWAVMASMTCAASLVFNGGTIKPASGQTVTLAVCPQAGLVQIFDKSAGGTIALAKPCDRYPQWWGAVMDGTTDDTVAWQAAVDSFSSGISKAATGRLVITGPSAVANVQFINKSIEVAGCSSGGQTISAQTPTPCYIKNSDATGGLPTFVITSTVNAWFHNLRFIGNNPVHPNKAAIELKAVAATGISQYDHFSDIVIGPYNNGVGTESFTDGILSDGDNANNDSMLLENLISYQNAGCGINITRQQHVNWEIHTMGSSFNGIAGICTTGQMEISNVQFGGNPIDILIQADTAGFQSIPYLNIHGMGSEASGRYIATDGSGLVFPTIRIENSKLGFGNGNTPVDDGPCGPGTGNYAHCSKVFKFDGVPVSFVCSLCVVAGGTSGAGYQWIASFANPGVGYNVDMLWESPISNFDNMSQHFLLGSVAKATTPPFTGQHFKLVGAAGTTGQNFEYWCGDLCGTVSSFVPTNGVLMQFPWPSSGQKVNPVAWTPQLKFGGGNTGMVATQTGDYIVEPGGDIHLRAQVIPSNLGSSTGAAQICNLPFTSGTNLNQRWGGAIAFASGFSTITTPPIISLNQNSTCIDLYKSDLSGGQLTNSNFTTSTNLQIELVYHQ